MLDSIIQNGIVVTMEPDCQPFIGSVGIKNGRFAAVTHGSGLVPAAEVIDATGKIVFPGMINGHVHGDMTVLRGLGDDLTLGEQNDIYQNCHFFLDDLTPEDRFYSRQLTYIEALHAGTTFLLEHEYFSLEFDSIRAMEETGMMGGISEDVRKHFWDPNELIDDKFFTIFIEKSRKAGIIPLLSCVAEDDFDLSLLKKIYEYARQKGVMVTQHFAETDWRMKLIAERFGTTPVRLLAENGLLDIVPIIGSHSVHVTQEEIGLLAGSKFRVVNTPLCEMKITDGVAPIPGYLKGGILTGLGSDGALWNNSNDLFREIKGTVLLHAITSGIRSVSARQALEMATIRGAQVFDLEDEIGSIRTGKRADFILVDATCPHMQPIRVGHYENVLSALAFCATGQDVESTFIGGRAVMEHGKVLGVHEENVMEAVREANERVLSRYAQDALCRKP